MPKAANGIYKPLFLTRAGKKALNEFKAVHPEMENAAQVFRKKFPKYWKPSKFYHQTYVCKVGCSDHLTGGFQHRESTGKSTLDEAKGARAVLVGAITKGESVNGNEILVKELLDGVLPYAEVHCKRSTASAYKDTLKHLAYFDNYRAVDLCINESIVTAFIASKLKTHKKVTINGMLNILELAFSLAEARLPMRPNIGKHKFKKLNNARKGYFSAAEFVTLCNNLPEDLRRPVQVLYFTGWRLMEILSRQRRHVDWKREGIGALILEAESSKNNEPRIFPLFADLKAVLEEQERATKEFERREGRLVRWLFHHEGEALAKYYPKRGNWKPTRYFLKCWKDACSVAKLTGKIRHDFRRGAVRRWDSIPDHIGMRLSGHKSHTVYLDYKATTEKDVFEATKKLNIKAISRPAAK